MKKKLEKTGKILVFIAYAILGVLVLDRFNVPLPDVVKYNLTTMLNTVLIIAFIGGILWLFSIHRRS